MESHQHFHHELPEFSYTFKIELIGSKGSGKTSLRRRIVDNTYEAGPMDRRASRSTQYPVENAFNVETILDIWDISDDNKYMYSNFNKAGTHALVLVLDLSNMDSYAYLNEFLTYELNKHYDQSVSIMLVATKSDAKRVIYVKQVKNLETLIDSCGHEYMGYLEVSAKCNENINDFLYELTNGLLNKYLPEGLKQPDYVSYFQEKQAKSILMGIKRDIQNPHTDLSLPMFNKVARINTENGLQKDVAYSIKCHLDYIETAELNTIDRRRYYHALSCIEESCKMEKLPILTGNETREYFKSNSDLTSTLGIFGNGKKLENMGEIKSQIQVKNETVKVEPLHAFECSISFDIFKDPVMVVTSGQTYEREMIEEHFNKTSKNGIANDPLTNTPFQKKDIVTNFKVKEIMDEFNQKYLQENSSTKACKK